MKQFIAFVRKEFHHILRDRRTMLILIGMPIVQIILFGFAISTEVRNVQTAILAPSLQTDVRKVMEQLDASEYFTVKYVVQSPDEIERLFRRNLIELAVVFPSDLHRLRFDSEEIQILADATDPNLAVTRSTYAQTILRQAMQTLRQTTTTSAYSQPDKQPVMVYNKLLYNPQMKSAYNFVPGVMGLILMLICAMMTSISIVREKETGTISVEGSSLFRAFPAEPDDHPAALRLCARCTDSRKPACPVRRIPIVHFRIPGIGTAYLLHHSYASSCPVSVGHGTDDTHHHPVGHYLPLSCLIPARWYVETVRRLMIEGVPLVYVWKEVAVMCLMAVVLITATARKFKNRLE